MPRTIISDDDEIELRTDDEASVEIDIVDDTPENDKGKPRRAPGKEADVPGDDEIETYGEKVQKRLKALKFEYHEERRRKEDAERVREEAVTFAQHLANENAKLRSTLKTGEESLIKSSKDRVAAELSAAEKAYKEAYESGDTDKIVDAQKRIARFSAEQVEVERYQPVHAEPAQSAEFRPATDNKPSLSSRDKEWMAENPWFMKDKRMTSFALGLHDELRDRGVKIASDEYYREVDAELRKTFPDKFDSDVDVEDDKPARKAPPQVVAPARRTPGKSPKKVTLTATQVQLAHRLGITPEQYAKQLVKEGKYE
jgi:hypothetical protein